MSSKGPFVPRTWPTPLNQLPASVTEYLFAIYLVPKAFFFQALWGLPVAAHSLDQEHHLGLVLSLYPDTFLL